MTTHGLHVDRGQYIVDERDVLVSKVAAIHQVNS
jgi:hypothetical protein